MGDAPYQAIDFRLSEMSHAYGAQVHLLADPVLLTELALLAQPTTGMPQLAQLMRSLYTQMGRSLAAWCLPRSLADVPTRMRASTPAGVWQGQILRPDTQLVVVDIARAGTLPAQTLFELLCTLVQPAGVRQDHLMMNRVHGADGQVVGVDVLGAKAHGPVRDAIVLIPDPMGATGTSMRRAIEHYKGHPDGPPQAIVAMNLIVTPEYLTALGRAHPDVAIVAARLDRGLSSTAVRASGLGEHWQQECGLNANHYIVPGAGGLGEVLNNCAD